MSSLKAFAKEARRNAAPEPLKKKPVKGMISSHLSTEHVQDSSEEEEEEESDEESSSDDEPARKRHTVAVSTVNGRSVSKLAPPKAADSDDSDSDSSDSSAPAKPAVTVPKTNGKKASNVAETTKIEASDTDSSSSSESSGSSEGDSSEESEEETATPSVKKSQPIPEPASQKPKDPKTVSFTKPEPFIPPSGFKLQSIRDTTKASQLLNKSNLKGKQIWYITAPASVSMEAIETMSWPGDVQKNAVISFNGKNYGFVQGTAEAKASTKFMVPNSSDDGYRSGSKGIDNILHLQQVVKLPNMNEDSTASQATVPAKKPVRQQPKGLKMRFKPSGFGDGETGKIGSSSEDDEMPKAPVRFRKPASLSAESSDEGSEKSSSSEVGSSSSGSGSDVEMADAPAAPTSKHNPVIKKPTTIMPPTVGALKRKHTYETPEKNSSSSSKLSTNPALSTFKKSKASQTPQADSSLVSTEISKAKAEGLISPPKRVKPNKTVKTVTPQLSSMQRESPIPPPSSSTARPTVRESPIPPPPSSLKKTSSLAGSSSSSLPASKSSAILPPTISSISKSTTTPALSSSPLLPKKQTVNQISAAAPIKNTPILPPMLRTMSSQASMSSTTGTPTPKKKKHKEKSEKSKKKSEID